MSYRAIAAALPAFALAGTGLAISPTAQAATTYVTAATAGTKVVGAATYIWGATNAAPGASICSQVKLSAGWRTVTCAKVRADRSYTIELTHGKTTPGTYTFRAVSGNVASPAVALTRTSATAPAPTTSAPTSPAPASATRYTTAPKTNVRSAMSTTSSIVGKLDAGTKVTGTISGTWLRVSEPSTYAGRYISTTVLVTTAPTGSTTTQPTTPTPAPASVTRYTTGSPTNVRSAASTSSSLFRTVPADTQVIGTISGTWMRITAPSDLAGKYISTTVLAEKPAKVEGAPDATTGLVYDNGVLGNAYTLYSGYNGVKVYLARKELGLSLGPKESTMDAATTDALKRFQTRNTISPATGVLDQKTWDALRPLDKDGVPYPFTIDSWAKTADVMDDAPRDVRVAASISFARAQLGSPYIWGGTGPMGFDCSGLLLQAARAGGMKPVNVSNFINVSILSNLSDRMLKDPEFQKGSLNNLQVGDLIYYGGADGVAKHVSMYVGNGQVINAVYTMVQYSSLSDNFGYKQKLGVNRPFAL